MVQAVRKVSKRLHIVAQREEFCDFFFALRGHRPRKLGARGPLVFTQPRSIPAS
jgi:hypothetical protein